MKYDLTKERTRGAQRTLDDFSTAMFHLIAEKSFDEINVNELCTLSNYPRATFYNYFDDKFDLLNYCWYVLGCEIKLDDFRELPKEQLLATYLDRIYDLLSIKQKELDAILFNNGLSSSLTSSLRLYLQKRMREIFNVNIEACAPKIQGRIPLELLADHFSNTLLLVLEWIFFKRNKISKQEAHAYLAYLLENF